MKQIVAQPITAEAFAPYGQLLDHPDGPGRADYSKNLENRRLGVPVCFRTSLTEKTSLPLKTKVMEKHEFSSQAFLPVTGGRYVLMCAPKSGDGSPDFDQLQAFIVPPHIGINYKADTWHHPMTVLDEDAVMATVMYSDGGPADEEWATLPEEVEIIEG